MTRGVAWGVVMWLRWRWCDGVAVDLSRVLKYVKKKFISKII